MVLQIIRVHQFPVYCYSSGAALPSSLYYFLLLHPLHSDFLVSIRCASDHLPSSLTLTWNSSSSIRQTMCAWSSAWTSACTSAIITDRDALWNQLDPWCTMFVRFSSSTISTTNPSLLFISGALENGAFGCITTLTKSTLSLINLRPISFISFVWFISSLTI